MDDDDDEGRAPPTKLALLQTSHAPSGSSPRQQTASSAASLLLVCQDSKSQPANQTRRQADGQQPLVLGPPFNHLTATEAPPLAQLSAFTNAKANIASTDADSTPAADAMDTTQAAAPPPIQVKEESRRVYDSEDTCMDTHLEEEAEPCERGGEELDISFDSQFPDLISDLITEEANPVVAHSTAAAPSPPIFPTGVRYMVPPQPSPSSSFLPFPHPLPASSSTRLAAITDFSPEWSYPESTVPASLIQPGVLRCYCPDNQFRMSILERLEQMERRMAEMAARDNNNNNQQQQHHHYHQHQQQHGSQLATPPPPPLPEDHEQMWACALGHQRAAELLYGWNSSALGIPDSLGRLPLAVARSRGHTRLATALEELHTHTHMMPGDTHTPLEDTDTPATPQPQQPPSPLSTSPDTGLSSSSSLPSPSDPSSPSPSSAYSSAPAPMDTSPSSPSSSSSSLPVSPPSPSSLPPVSMWGEEPNPGPGTGLNPGSSRDSSLYLMDYESASPGHTHTYLHTHMAGGGRRAHITATLEEQLLSYSENAENEGEEEEEEEYLEEEVLQVNPDHRFSLAGLVPPPPSNRTGLCI
ncbi:Calmodulin-binding transcription activator 2 [Collichthys lucidus]|uniref:Calmodulin-binding transcription activator 2 n=1 Tax=Collichthys lucidus TaxID=240159 RepID=A0A4V6ATS1_COLLU|nr:Calmodulin-binding transcription activator 2 [Collichthys lucidus]